MLGIPKLNAALQGGGSHESGIEGQSYLLQLVGHTLDEAQDMVDFLGFKAALAGHAWFYTHWCCAAGCVLVGLWGGFAVPTGTNYLINKRFTSDGLETLQIKYCRLTHDHTLWKEVIFHELLCHTSNAGQGLSSYRCDGTVHVEMPWLALQELVLALEALLFQQGIAGEAGSTLHGFQIPARHEPCGCLGFSWLRGLLWLLQTK